MAQVATSGAYHLGGGVLEADACGLGPVGPKLGFGDKGLAGGLLGGERGKAGLTRTDGPLAAGLDDLEGGGGHLLGVLWRSPSDALSMAHLWHTCNRGCHSAHRHKKGARRPPVVHRSRSYSRSHMASSIPIVHEPSSCSHSWSGHLRAAASSRRH